MITKEQAYAWMDRQVEAYNMMNERLGGGIENITYNGDGIHVFNLAKLAEIAEHPYVRSYHDFDTDKLHFRYKGVAFFGITWDKRIGKKVTA